MVTRSLCQENDMSQHTHEDARDVILTMDHIVKRFGPVTALSGVDLTVERGEIHAICGENGAGKSTLMNVLSGVYPYGSYEGTITFDGKVCKYKNINDSEADGIVIIHQELALSPFLSIAENLFIGNECSSHGVIDWDKTRAEAKKLLDRVGLPEDPDTKIMDIGVGGVVTFKNARKLVETVKRISIERILSETDCPYMAPEPYRGRRNSSYYLPEILKKIAEIKGIAPGEAEQITEENARRMYGIRTGRH